MNKAAVIAVTLCGALVTGCSADTPEAEARVASSRQAVVSQTLEDSLACVQGYVDTGTCDWAHWSEMWETCETYDHPALEDGFFLDEVKAGNCTAANWPSLRAQLVASSAPVYVRANCDPTSEVLPQTEVNGCVTLDGTDASYVNVAPTMAVTLYSGAGCTGEALTVQADTNLCETWYPSGAFANDNVRSFRVQDAEEQESPARYDCAGDPTCVTNYNRNLAAVNSTHSVRIVRVTQSGRTTDSMTEIKSNINQMYDFFDLASHNQVKLNLLDGSHKTVNVASGLSCSKTKNQAIQAANNSGAFLTVFALPHGLCDASNAGSHRIFLNDGLVRTYAHETGHVLGLGHGNRIDETGKLDPYGDATTFMGRMPSDSYNLPQLHWLGWTKKQDLVQINSALAGGGSFDLTLRPVDRNIDDGSGLPLGAVWEFPTTGNRLFVAVPKSRTTNVNQFAGGNVAVYRAPKCVGCTGMAMGTTRLMQFGPKSSTAHIAQDIAITPVAYTSHTIRVDGANVEVFDTITLRFRQSVPVVLTPVAGAVASRNPTYSGTAQAGLKVNLFVDGVRVATPTATAEGTWSFTPTAALASGTHTVHVSATDVSGNVSPSSIAQAFTVP